LNIANYKEFATYMFLREGLTLMYVTQALEESTASWLQSV